MFIGQARGEISQELEARSFQGITLDDVRDTKFDSGRTCKTIEFTVLEENRPKHYKLNVWDKKLWGQLQKGVPANVGIERESNGRFWKLSTFEALPQPVDEIPLVPSSVSEQEVPPVAETAPAMAPTSPEKPLDERERVMRSMNALPAAATVFAALIEKDIIVPTDQADAVKIFAQLHQDFIKLHDAPPPDARRKPNTKQRD